MLMCRQYTQSQVSAKGKPYPEEVLHGRVQHVLLVLDGADGPQVAHGNFNHGGSEHCRCCVDSIVPASW